MAAGRLDPAGQPMDHVVNGKSWTEDRQLGAGAAGRVKLVACGAERAVLKVASDKKAIAALDAERKTLVDLRGMAGVRALVHPELIHLPNGARGLLLEWWPRTLEEVKDDASFTLPVRLAVLLGLADALSALHARGVTHDDLKPANVLVSVDHGRVALADVAGGAGTAAWKPPGDTGPGKPRDGFALARIVVQVLAELDAAPIVEAPDLTALGGALDALDRILGRAGQTVRVGSAVRLTISRAQAEIAAAVAGAGPVTAGLGALRDAIEAVRAAAKAQEAAPSGNLTAVREALRVAHDREKALSEAVRRYADKAPPQKVRPEDSSTLSDIAVPALPPAPPPGLVQGFLRALGLGPGDPRPAEPAQAARQPAPSTAAPTAVGEAPTRDTPPSGLASWWDLVPTVVIPAGTFLMGSPKGEEGRESHLEEQRTVQVPSFRIGITPITQRQYAAVARCDVLVPYALDPYPSGGKTPDAPVTNVSWEDAVKWCGGLSWLLRLPQAYDFDYHLGLHLVRRDEGVELPTEARWEYAARAGSRSRFWSGETVADLRRVGWFDANRLGDIPVGRLPANPWGLFDVHGNVWEWCFDHCGARDPASASDPFNEILFGIRTPLRMIRGGSGHSRASWCRSAYRNWEKMDKRSWSVGFRVMLPAALPMLDARS